MKADNWESGRDVSNRRNIHRQRAHRLLAMGGILAATVAMMSIAMAAESTSSRDAIVVEGNRRVEAETIRSYFHAIPAGGYDEAARDAALKSLIATGLFEYVSIDRKDETLVVRVTEAPVLGRVAFEGNKKVKDTDLSAAIESKPRGPLQRAMVQSDANRIVEIYRRAGRDEVSVNPEIIDRGNGSADLVYTIVEGAKTPVRKVEFTGNRAFGHRQLNAVIKTSAHSMLSFLTGGDAYDPDRIAQDRELLRTYYRSKGYADASVISARAEYDPAAKGFAVTFAIDEGPLYRFGAVDVVCNIPGIDAGRLSRLTLTRNGALFDGNALDKTTELLAIELSKLGYPFAHATPRITRDQATQRIDIAFVVDQGPRTYVERIEIHGNSRTRDYVIRREFDIGEGDAYNRALVDRAERRLKNLNYFKTVKITNEPGSAPDRVVLNVDVEEIPTGEFSISGGYSTASGWMAELSVSERNLLGQGQYARFAVQYGQYARGFELSFAEPYFMGNRLGVGLDLYAKQTLATNYISYNSQTLGVATRAGFALSEELSFQARYNIYSQKITLPFQYNDCQFSTNALIQGGTGVNPTNEAALAGGGCYANGESSLAVRKELAAGAVLVSMLGYTVAYNTLDNNRNPTAGIYAEFKQDFAGVGGDVNFVRSTVDTRSYYEMFSDVVAVLHLQGGHIAGWGGKELRMLDHFQMGPNLVRGFAPSGIGPRDITPGTNQDPLGGSIYWGASLEAQAPFSFLPKDAGLRGAVFADAGSLWDYRGPTSWNVTGETLQPAPDSGAIRASVGVGLIWNSPFGPLRFDYSFPLAKQGYDRIQQFRFGGGTKF